MAEKTTSCHPAVRAWKTVALRMVGIPSATDDVLRRPSPHATDAELMLDLGTLDVDEIAMALSDQTDYEHRWLIDPQTGEIAFWTSDTEIDGENPVDPDALDLMPIDPLPSGVWYADMADFAKGGQ